MVRTATPAVRELLAAMRTEISADGTAVMLDQFDQVARLVIATVQLCEDSELRLRGVADDAVAMASRYQRALSVVCSLLMASPDQQTARLAAIVERATTDDGKIQ